MIILGIAAEHNSSACLMVNGKVVSIIQEERLTKVKNQCAFPLLAIKNIIKEYLDNKPHKIDKVVYGSNLSDPYYTCLDRYSSYTVEDHINEMKELWYPFYYKKKRNLDSYWKKKFLNGEKINKNHNYDFTFLKNNKSLEEKINYFSNEVRSKVVKKYLPHVKKVTKVDHHTCHAYYAAYGGNLKMRKLKDTLILTADAWGDNKNWSASTVDKNGKLIRVGSGKDFSVARIYKFCTLILGMKPNEHEYKVMGLSGFSNSDKYISSIENIFFNILDFKKGRFESKKPLKESYFDLKNRLEGHRFDNIAAALQRWTSSLIIKWAEFWLKKTGKKGIAFSGGLSMNIKANGDLLENKNVNWLSVPPSGGDESLSAGACFFECIKSREKVFSMVTPYLGQTSNLEMESWYKRLNGTGCKKNDFQIILNFNNKKAAKLLANDEILSRCIGRAEFGARALGNRSILANPKNFKNIEKINNTIKNRDFWMPFTPSILSEHSNKLIKNPKENDATYMTIGYQSTSFAKENISACLHMADYSARPQFVKKELNFDYWSLINEFYKITKIPSLLNTSFNLHGDPMNYTIADAVRTLALSSLEFLLLPDEKLLLKKSAIKKIKNII